MIRDVNLTSRKALPPGLTEKLLRAHRQGVDSYSIAVCDHLAPAFESNVNYIPWGDTVGQVLELILFHCPPSFRVDISVNTMAPDKQNWDTCPPDQIAKQWESTIRGIKGWQSSQFLAVDRNDFYDFFPKVDCVIHTRCTRPYSNILVCVNPSGSETLRRIPQHIDPLLADRMSASGHSNAVAILHERILSSFKFGDRIKFFESKLSAKEMVGLLAGLWQSDEHVQKPTRVAQRPMCISEARSDSHAQELCAGLPGDWGRPEKVQNLPREHFQTELLDWRMRNVISVSGDTEVSWLMKNGTSGQNGGF